MSIKERAELAFKQLGTQNEVELDRILATVPKYNYRLADGEYRGRVDILFHAAMHWAFLYWQNYAKLMSVKFLEAIDYELPNKPFSWSQRIIALHITLERLSNSHGFDADTVYAIAEVSPETYPDDIIKILNNKSKEFMQNTEQDLIEMIEMLDSKE